MKALKSIRRRNDPAGWRKPPKDAHTMLVKVLRFIDQNQREASRHPLTDGFVLQKTRRQRTRDSLEWDQCVSSYLHAASFDWESPTPEFASAVLRFWRTLPEEEMTDVSTRLLSLADQGIEVREVFGER